MAWLKRKADPISERARSLNSEIAALEAQIKQLDSQLQRGPAQPRLRSTAMPQRATVTHASVVSAPVPVAPPPPPTASEPIFEDVSQERLKTRAESANSHEHYNELGVRKYDFPALIRRVQAYFQGPTAMNPKLVSYLAAGGIQGLRPIRYEKRVARNRFILLVIVLFLLLLGIIAVMKP